VLGLLQATEADQQVDAFLDRVDEMVGEGHRQLQVGVLLAELQQHRHHHQAAEG